MYRYYDNQLKVEIIVYPWEYAKLNTIRNNPERYSQLFEEY